jgi:hypothetical protein
MSSNVAWALIVVIAMAAVGLIIWAYLRRKRTRQLRGHFGPEYDHVVDEKGSRSRAEAELRQREKRVERLSIKPLLPERRARFSEQWRQQQSRFVDEPRGAIEDADRLVEEVMKERGYPVGDFDQKVADISVDHPYVIDRYRAAHDIADRQRRGQATTEDLRQAMIYYRDLFMELLEEPMPEGARVR